MAKHLVKCLYCGQTFDTNSEPFVKPRANRYAHKACAEAAENEKTQEQKDKEALEKYILQLFNISCISPKIRKQIDLYTSDNYRYSYQQIHKALRYFYDVRQHSTEKANGGIGIVPYVVREAVEYYRAISEAQQKNEAVIEAQQTSVPAREVHIEPPKREPFSRLARLFSFLDEEEVE